MPLEFVPPTILLIICAVVWLLVRLDRFMAGPVEVPRELTMADLEAAWAQSAPLREAALHADPYDHDKDGI